MLAIQFLDSYDDGYLGSADSANQDHNDNNSQMVAWEIQQLSSQGIISWDNYTFTSSVSGYEQLFNQDLNGDDYIGADLSTLTEITTDIIGDQLQVDNEGAIYIWDGVDETVAITVKDAYGGSPSYSVSYGNEGDDYYFSLAPYAVYKDTTDPNDEHYKIAIKQTDSYVIEAGSNPDVNVSWEILKVSLAGVIDYSNTVFTDSITPFEDEFGFDMNGDGNATGAVDLTPRNTDQVGTYLAEETGGGALFIVDTNNTPNDTTDDTQIQIYDSYLESSSNWGDGHYKSVAIAVSELNNNDTVGDSSDDYYQLAVKQSGSYLNYNGISESYEDWQIYAVDTSGFIKWENTVWTQSVQSFENTFGQDLDGDNKTGINIGNLTTSSWTAESTTIEDEGPWVLKKIQK